MRRACLFLYDTMKKKILPLLAAALLMLPACHRNTRPADVLSEQLELG